MSDGNSIPTNPAGDSDKPCSGRKEERRRYYEKHREEILAKNRQWQAENKERCRLQKLEYRAKNREAVRARSKRWADKNRDKILAAKRAHYQKNKEKHRAKCKECYERRKAQDPEAVKRRQQRDFARWYAGADKKKLRAREREYRKAHPERIRAMKQREYRKHGQKIRERVRARYWRDPESRREETGRRRKAHLDWLTAFCAAHGCKRCGESDARVLDFHHRDPSQRFKRVPNLWGSSRRVILWEIKKCDILCANCHALAEAELKALSGKRPKRRGTHLDLLTRLKAMRGCVVCGLRDPVCLHFHHWDRAGKTTKVATLVNRPLGVIARELARCEVRCANCHRRLHARKGRRG